MRKTLLLTMFVFVIGSAMLFTTRTDTHANASGAPAYETGSPGDGGNCTDCHGGTAAAGGTITSNIPVSGYVAGTTYNFTVSISGTSANNYGFELACETTAGAFIGTLSAPGTGAKLISTSNFVTHNTPGTGTTKSWTCSWTAPATGAPSTVTFYAAFLVGNNNGSNSGDATKVTSKTYSLSAPCTMSGNLVTQSNVSCNGGNNGSATISGSGGTGPYTYNWAPGGGTSATASGLTPGTYTCTIHDAGSCSSTQVVTITQPAVVATGVASKTNVSCNGGSNGTASISASGGTGPYSYSWSPAGGTSATASNLAAGNYTCTITDANGCAKTQTLSVTQPAVVSSNVAASSAVSCNGGNNGSATISAAGGTAPYSYNWAPSGGTSATANGLSAGSYTCTITDANGCAKTQALSLTQPSSIVASIPSHTNASCLGSNNGAASVTASGGTGPYTYYWSPSGSTGTTATSLLAGTYTCTVTDANGCTKSQTVSITEPANGISSSIASLSNISCSGMTNGSASISASGGSGSYSYSWLPSGGSLSTASGLAAGIYSCTISDAGSCTRTQTVQITQPSQLSATASQANIGCNSTTGQAQVSVSGGTAPYMYAWSPSGGTGATANGLSAGSYTCSIADANNCTNMQFFTITASSSPPAININSSNNHLCMGQSAVLTASGANSYTWSTGQTTATISVSPVATTIYTVEGSSGCTGNSSIVLTVNPIPVVSASSSMQMICAGQTTTLSASGASAYAWSDGSTGSAIQVSPSSTTAYTVTGTDANNCSSSAVLTESVSICTGIDVAMAQDGPGLYPNPNSGSFTLDLSAATHVMITNVFGDLIYDGMMEQGLQPIDMGGRANGLYFVQCSNQAGHHVVIKMLKQ